MKVSKKICAGIIAASFFGMSAFAGGGVYRDKNDDGTPYALSSLLMYYLNSSLGTNYSMDDQLYYWEQYPSRTEIPKENYKQITFPHDEGRNYGEYSLPGEGNILAIADWDDLPELTSANIENGIQYIVHSFNNCPKLESVVIPKSVSTITSSFSGTHCTIYGVPGSYAESYALQNGITFRSGAQVTVNGNSVQFDQPAFIQDGRTMVPMRKIFDALGAEVSWDGDTQTVTATKGSTTISLQIGSNVLNKNGKSIEVDVPAFLQNGRTLVPIRAISESLDASVNWDSETQTVVITE